MVVNYDRHRAAIERLYEDRATIKRHGKSRKPSGETTLGLVVIHEDQPCRLSQKQLAVNGQTEAQNDIAYDAKLFISPDLEIRQGDDVVVTRGKNTATGWQPIGAAVTYTAGEPFPPYPTHQELNLSRRGTA